MKVPNYPPNMFGPMHSHHETKKQGNEERDESDEEWEEEWGDMDFEEDEDD